MKYQIRVTSHYLEKMDLTVVTEEVLRLAEEKWESVAVSVCGSHLGAPDMTDPSEDYAGHVEAAADALSETVLETLRDRANEAWQRGCRTSDAVPVTAELDEEAAADSNPLNEAVRGEKVSLNPAAVYLPKRTGTILEIQLNEQRRQAYAVIRFEASTEKCPIPETAKTKLLQANDASIQKILESPYDVLHQLMHSLKPQLPVDPTPGPIVAPTPVPRSRPRYYFVFQNPKLLEVESSGCFLWAPDDERYGFWNILDKLRVGDVIFHGCKEQISAISVVQSPACSKMCPPELRDHYGVINGRYVESRYYRYAHPIPYSHFRDDILRLGSGGPGDPFDKNGKGRRGYCFSLNSKLATIFFRGIVKKNPLVGGNRGIYGFPE